MVVDLSPSCRATLSPWGSGGMSVLLRAGFPGEVRMAALVCPVGDGWWSRAEVPSGLPDPLRPFRPYGVRMPLEDAVRWASSVLDPFGEDSRGVAFVRDSRPVEALGALLRGPGLLESLWVMES